jgi:transcription elongation factor Elf1
MTANSAAVELPGRRRRDPAQGVSILLRAYFRSERCALLKVERIRWPSGAACPRCGAADRVGRVIGKGARPGLKFCGRCHAQFRATIGTPFERSHVPLHKWLQACLLLSAPAGPISPHRLHLHLEVAPKTADFMLRRLAAVGRHHAVPRWRFRSSDRCAARTAIPADWGSQFRDFVKLARSLGCCEEEAAFDRLLRDLVALPAPAVQRPASTRSTIAGAAPR